MENFYLDDNFCTDICDLMTHLDIEEEEVKDLPEDWSVDIEETTLEPMFTLTAEEILDAIQDKIDLWHEDRYPEDPENICKKIGEAIKQGIDLEKINSAIPSLYYANGTMSKITKQDLLEYIN